MKTRGSVSWGRLAADRTSAEAAVSRTHSSRSATGLTGLPAAINRSGSQSRQSRRPSLRTRNLDTATVATLQRKVFTVPDRLVRSGRRLTLRLPKSWPWAEQIETAIETNPGHPAPLLNLGEAGGPAAPTRPDPR